MSFTGAGIPFSSVRMACARMRKAFSRVRIVFSTCACYA
jgi:hypothetical protein